MVFFTQEPILRGGKGLGGSSNTNFLIHSRGHPKDFEAWALAVDDSSWGYESLLPFFKRHEDYHGAWLSEFW